MSCAPPARYRQPSDLRAYQIVVGGADSLSLAIARRLRQRGFHVRAGVRGGNAPAAYLLAFTRHDAEAGTPVWLHVRLADTRTGAVVAGVSVPLDSLGASIDARARAIADSLAGAPPPRDPKPPS